MRVCLYMFVCACVRACVLVECLLLYFYLLHEAPFLTREMKLRLFTKVRTSVGE